MPVINGKQCCDMCYRPLTSTRHKISVLLRPELTLIVGPDCFRKEKKARKAMLEKHTPREIEALRAKVAAQNAG